MKWIGVVILVVLLAGSWLFFARTGTEIEKKQEMITRLTEGDGDVDEQIPGIQTDIDSLKGQQTFNGILLAFLSAGVVGVLFVIFVLPLLAHRLTHAVYDSAEETETDPLHDARSLMAQGRYEEAIDAFKAAAALDPLNRLPWVEIAKIQRVNLENPAEAIRTLRQALEGQEWEINDAAYFIFRIAELYDEDLRDRHSAVTLLRQVIDEFPDTRHSANARHKLHEWGQV